MNNFCTKTLTQYVQHKSEYSKRVVGGWPESSYNYFRTNENFKPKKEQSKDLHNYEPHLAVNEILLLKISIFRQNVDFEMESVHSIGFYDFSITHFWHFLTCPGPALKGP